MSELEKLKGLLDRGQVKLGINIRQMNAPGSPVYQTWENVTVPAILLVGSLLATMYIHTWLGFAILALGAAWWILKVLPKIRDGVFDRSAAFALSSEAAFDALWAKGVLSLYAKMPDGTERAAAKRQDWRAFVRALPES
ncbi:hypothetical protein SAMN02745194_00595 [Roseomonas rosea]|uniref:Uncharacterized protein n=1 Tax=Muricoccus roseus TaxID=198092 RepID=A0A1M6C5X9_9PROT|nr:hypothetical protein [Roseomonas rosea]SHI56372.1 hypothetical protein SAMN02745194_00595 [Roseomonas rosea]